jgi:hypothetical protein
MGRLSTVRATSTGDHPIHTYDRSSAGTIKISYWPTLNNYSYPSTIYDSKLDYTLYDYPIPHDKHCID